MKSQSLYLQLSTDQHMHVKNLAMFGEKITLRIKWIGGIIPRIYMRLEIVSTKYGGKCHNPWPIGYSEVFCLHSGLILATD